MGNGPCEQPDLASLPCPWPAAGGLGRILPRTSFFPVKKWKANTHSSESKVCRGGGGATEGRPLTGHMTASGNCWHRPQLGVRCCQPCQGIKGGLSPAWHLFHVTPLPRGWVGCIAQGCLRNLLGVYTWGTGLGGLAWKGECKSPLPALPQEAVPLSLHPVGFPGVPARWPGWLHLLGRGG